jgi:hypothetical protein
MRVWRGARAPQLRETVTPVSTWSPVTMLTSTCARCSAASTPAVCGLSRFSSTSTPSSVSPCSACSRVTCAPRRRPAQPCPRGSALGASTPVGDREEAFGARARSGAFCAWCHDMAASKRWAQASVRNPSRVRRCTCTGAEGRSIVSRGGAEESALNGEAGNGRARGGRGPTDPGRGERGGADLGGEVGGDSVGVAEGCHHLWGALEEHVRAAFDVCAPDHGHALVVRRELEPAHDGDATARGRLAQRGVVEPVEPARRRAVEQRHDERRDVLAREGRRGELEARRHQQRRHHRVVALL